MVSPTPRIPSWQQHGQVVFAVGTRLPSAARQLIEGTAESAIGPNDFRSPIIRMTGGIGANVGIEPGLESAGARSDPNENRRNGKRVAPVVQMEAPTKNRDPRNRIAKIAHCIKYAMFSFSFIDNLLARPNRIEYTRDAFNARRM
jgi:hypothetical protein